MNIQHRVAAALVAVAALLALSALPALAKEGAIAQLDAPVVMDTPPGTTIDIGWSVFAVDPAGGTQPIFGSPIYVRIVPRGGGEAVEVDGIERPAGSGHYVASVTVPEGIGELSIAMDGQACDASGCWEADYTFPLNDDPQVVPPVAGGTTDRSAGAAADPAPIAWIAVAVTGLAIAAAVVASLANRRATVRIGPA